jgi:glycosyltransferase involved in cell wall biosynthesis
VVPLDDAPALAAAFGRLAADPDLRARLGAEGRERVREHFLLERWLREMQAEFDRALAAGPVRVPGRDAASPSA